MAEIEQGPTAEAREAPRRDSSSEVVVRQATLADVPAIYQCQVAAYSALPVATLCDERMLHLQIEAFPEGQLVAIVDQKIVAYAFALIVQLDESTPWYSYTEITGGGTFSTHDPSGDTLYGADIAVHPDYRGRRIAQHLYDGRRTIMRRFNLRRMVAGGRIPGYAAYAGKLSPEEYVEKVQQGELRDRALGAHLRAGYRIRGVHMGYLRDAQSLDYATFLEMENPAYESAKRRIAGSPMKRPVRKIRVCATQYEMRSLSGWEEFEHQVEFFVTTAAEYHSHFLLLPELFTVQLFSTMDPSIEPREAVLHLADMADRYREMFVKMAKRTGLFIIGGSHPVRVGGGVRNVAHLFTPTGNVYTQEKLHITPNEKREYGIEPGTEIKVFETSHARIAIIICYDIEFPELARLVTFAGAEVLFVPFSTDERKAYLRVRYSGQARAVENEIYTVMSGNVGNLPKVENFLINYGQAVICTPSDFAFPMNGIAAEGDFNSETVVITDLDLVALEETRDVGSVRPLRDRRPDLYSLKPRVPVQVIRAD